MFAVCPDAPLMTKRFPPATHSATISLSSVSMDGICRKAHLVHKFEREALVGRGRGDRSLSRCRLPQSYLRVRPDRHLPLAFMSTDFADIAFTQIRDITNRLQNPIPDYTTLLQLLSAPLACIDLLPPRFRQYNVSPLPAESFAIHRHILPLQRALLEHVIQDWEPMLVQEDSYGLLEQYFCPDLFFFASPAAGQVALHAYSSILSLPLTDYSTRLLVKLSQAYPIDVLHSVIFSDESKTSGGRRTITWEDCVRDAIAIPSKVANIMQGKDETPAELEQGAYLNKVSARCEVLVAKLCVKPSKGMCVPSPSGDCG